MDNVPCGGADKLNFGLLEVAEWWLGLCKLELFGLSVLSASRRRDLKFLESEKSCGLLLFLVVVVVVVTVVSQLSLRLQVR